MDNTEQQIEESKVIVTYDENGFATILLKEFNDIKNVNIPSCTIKEIKLLSNALSDTDSKYITKLIYIENKLKDIEKVVNKLPTKSNFDTLYNKVSRINDYIYELKNPKIEDSEETKKFLAEQKVLNDKKKEELLKQLLEDEINDNEYNTTNYTNKNTHKVHIKDNCIIHKHDLEYTKDNFYNEATKFHGEDILKTVVDMDYSWYKKKFSIIKEVPIIHEYTDNAICIFLKDYSDLKDIEEQIKDKTIKEIKLI
jgi:hypothetical protein